MSKKEIFETMAAIDNHLEIYKSKLQKKEDITQQDLEQITDKINLLRAYYANDIHITQKIYFAAKTHISILLIFVGLFFLFSKYLNYKQAYLDNELNISSKNADCINKISDLEESIQKIELQKNSEPSITIVESSAQPKCTIVKPKSQQEKCK